MFVSPLYRDDRQADLPWHSADDLRAILDLAPGIDAMLRRDLRADWREPVTVATRDGLTTIAPHFMAEGLLAAVAESGVLGDGRMLKRVVGHYRRSTTEATKLMVAHMSPIERMVFTMTALNGN
jgi:hypothetical protein